MMGVDEHTLRDGQVWVCINNDAEDPIANAGIFHTSWCSALMRTSHVTQVPKSATTELSECQMCSGHARDSHGRELVARLRSEWQEREQEQEGYNASG
jgi:hypothetical protein